MRAVRKHTDSKWLLLYIERWLKAPVQARDGTLGNRAKGSPQGSVISPLLANLFLHYAFDEWMRRNYGSMPFERYADDIVVHCGSEKQAKRIKTVIEQRLKQCRLELHPEKTKIVYCKDSSRKGSYPNEKFDFLGYTFRPRLAKNRHGQFFVNFSPAVSDKAVKSMRRVIRSWRIHRRTDKSLADFSCMFNPVLRGWVNYYARYCKSALFRVFNRFNRMLVKWAMKKYRKFRRHQRRATHWLGRLALRESALFSHWHKLGMRPMAGQ